MTDLFLKVLNTGISAGWLVLAVLMLRPLLRRAPKWAAVLLWGLVAARLLLPFSIQSPLSLIPSAQTVPADIGLDPTPGLDTGFSSLDQVINPVITEHYAPGAGLTSINPLQGVAIIGTALWVLGMAVMALYALVSYGLLRHRVRTAVLLEKNICQCDRVDSPFILGLLRPRIYLPFCLPDTALPLVLAHERAHLRRRDHWWKPLGFLLLSVHWFNPLLWLAYVLLCQDIELACDEAVIRGLNPGQRADYSQTLLQCSIRRGSIAACPLAFGEGSVKKRIRNVLQYKKPGFWLVALTLALCAALALGFLTDPVSRPSLEWAKGLNPADIKNAVLLITPEDPAYPSCTLTEAEYRRLAALLNESHGAYEPEPEPLAGRSICFAIGTRDGALHEVSNIGNTYLRIDGDCYKADYSWLVTWEGAWDTRAESPPELPSFPDDCLLQVEIAAPDQEPEYLYFEPIPFPAVALPGAEAAVFEIREASDCLHLVFPQPLTQEGRQIPEVLLHPGSQTTLSQGDTDYTFSLVARDAVPPVPLESEDPVFLQSGERQIIPVPLLIGSKTWGGDAWLMADMPNYRDQLPQLLEQLPVLECKDEVLPCYNQGVSFHSLSVFDENLEPLEDCTDWAHLDALPEGRYHIGILVTRQGDFIPSQQEWETVSLACGFTLIK